MEVECSKESKEPPLTFFERVYRAYVYQLRNVTKFFRKRDLDLIGDAIVAFSAEPLQTLIAAQLTVIGKVPEDQFHHHDLNPEKLSYYKETDIAVLLIHGAGSNQGLCKPLAKKLQDANIGPVFTINMPKVMSVLNYKREVQQEEKDAVRNRLNQIKQLYIDQGKPLPKFVIVGLSRGGDAGLAVCDEDNEIARVVRLGKVTPRYQLSDMCVNKLVEIEGGFDAICHWRSCLPKEARYTVNTGHLGLIYSNEAHQIIIKVIKETKA